MGAMKL